MSIKTTPSLNNRPIGIFDSGIGGTSIWKEIHDLLPMENTIYLADSKNAPYGTKSRETIISLCEKNTELLLEKNCKLIVVACNTATTNAIKHLRENYSIPFIGIEPAIKPALLNSKNRAIGILATKGTLSSKLFHTTANLYRKNVHLVEQDGTGIVELMENGKLNSSQMNTLLSACIDPMIEQQIDYLVLGCSHYPYLIPQLRKLLPEHVTIIDSGLAVAKQTKAILKEKELLASRDLEDIELLFYTNGNKLVLATILENKYDTISLEF